MVRSVFPDLPIPQTDVLSYALGDNISKDPIWIDAEDPSRALSLHDLRSWVRRLAISLKRHQLQHGDVVLVFTPNHIFVPVAYFGVTSYGAVFTGANPAYTVGELSNLMRDTGAKLVLLHPSLAETAIKSAKEVGLPLECLMLFSDRPVQPVRGLVDWFSILPPETECECGQLAPFDSSASKTRAASLNYSSGTTGLPKGVYVSHHALIANSEQIIFMRDYGKPYSARNRPEERWVGFLPLYHAYGQVYNILMAAKLRTKVFVMKTFNYERFLWVVQTYKITHLQIAPPIMIMLNKRPETEKYDLSSVIDVLCGAAPLSMALQNEVTKKFGFTIRQGWGMTEVTCGGLNMPADLCSQTGSVGMLHPNSFCKLVDDMGNEVGPGERGELYYKGPNVALGYWRNPAATKEAFSDDGWLKTGDIAVMDHKGMVWIVDRKKELIKVSGLQVAPAELEAILLQHDDIADAAVVGITSGEEEFPRAYVVLKDMNPEHRPTERSIQSWVEERVAKHKRLQGGVAFVKEIPKLASGKIQRKTMREWAKQDAKLLATNIKHRL
ncbi:uncharacterized protein PV06_02903 [Exophiala oligosperma]|uniref:4-coumarate-CoA ligase n=1 Tax=Exophiala oligosperma TaxID=215243 RepID=A0A0D2C3U3_9EURO|nr:uncharacterized protein PV06_02903 [Exophiala oligosperma]KIW44432.1 hypothetical protein PV06_02903 [Exophiala oligosperma]